MAFFEKKNDTFVVNEGLRDGGCTDDSRGIHRLTLSRCHTLEGVVVHYKKKSIIIL